MVAETVALAIDDLIDELDARVLSATKARSDKQRAAREAVAIRVGDALHDAWLAHEEVLCGQRDWIDAHRRDNQPDFRFADRWDEFWTVTVRQHAAAGEALERAAGTLTWRS